MPRHAPVLSLRIVPQLRTLRGQKKLLYMAEHTGIPAPILSQLERGERLPRPRDIAGLRRGYGPEERWYIVKLEAEED